MEICRDQAPGVDIRCIPPQGAASAQREMADGSLDLAVMVSGIPEDLRARRLYDDRFLVMVADDHPIEGPSIELSTFASYPHVLTAPLGNSEGSHLSRRLAQEGFQRRVAVTVPHFSMGPQLLAGSLMLLTLPERLAIPLAEQHGHRLLELAFDTPPISVSMTWHERAHRDPSHRWFRDAMMQAASTGKAGSS